MAMQLRPQKKLSEQDQRKFDAELAEERRACQKQREDRSRAVARAVTERDVSALAELWRAIERDAERLGPSATDVAELRRLTRALAAEAAALGVPTRLAAYDAVLAQFDAGATRLEFGLRHYPRLVALRAVVVADLVAIEAAFGLRAGVAPEVGATCTKPKARKGKGSHGDVLRELVKDPGRTRTAIAKAAGVSRQSLYKMTFESLATGAKVGFDAMLKECKALHVGRNERDGLTPIDGEIADMRLPGADSGEAKLPGKRRRR